MLHSPVSPRSPSPSPPPPLVHITSCVSQAYGNLIGHWRISPPGVTGGGLKVSDIDAFWLQRSLSKFYPDANASQRIAEVRVLPF